MTDQPADVPSVNELREFLTGQPVEPRPPIIEQAILEILAETVVDEALAPFLGDLTVWRPTGLRNEPGIEPS